MRPAITVVIPTFQCARYLGQAVRSVLAQEFCSDAIEIVVVDDGSTDDTAAVASGLGVSIRYIYQHNQGVAAARNRGIKEARGDYVAFLDADDYWLPDRLRLMVAKVEDTSDTLVTTDYIISEGGRLAELPTYGGRSLQGLFDLTPQEQLVCALEDNFLSYMMMAHRGVFDRVGGFDEGLHYGEDWELWLRCLAAGHRVRLVDRACAVYRHLRPGSSTTRNDFAKASDRVRILSRYRDQITPRRWSTAVGVMHHVGFRECMRARDWGSAFEHALGLALNPAYVRAALRAQKRRIEEHSPEPG